MKNRNLPDMLTQPKMQRREAISLYFLMRMASKLVVSDSELEFNRTFSIPARNLVQIGEKRNMRLRSRRRIGGRLAGRLRFHAGHPTLVFRTPVKIFDARAAEHRSYTVSLMDRFSVTLCCWPAYRSIRVGRANSSDPTHRPEPGSAGPYLPCVGPGY